MNPQDASAWRESVVAIDLAGTPGFGLLAEPNESPLAPDGMTPQRCDVGVLIIVGGPQYRVGAHRHFVKLARHLAKAGITSFRFDHRGVGDSAAPLRSFEALDDDIANATSALLAARPHLHGVVLWGLCDAAAASLLYVARRNDPRIRGLALLNPWVRSAQSEAATRLKHYYWERLRSFDFWRKLASGGLSVQAMRDWWQARQLARSKPVAERSNRSTPSDTRPASLAYQDLMAQGWKRASGPLLLQLCPDDFTAQEFLQTIDTRASWQGWQARADQVRFDYPGADHTFSQALPLQASMEDLARWVQQSFQGGTRSTTTPTEAP
jgi:exosortase A-associated hydrolase 1